jgi:hypothetical protein
MKRLRNTNENTSSLVDFFAFGEIDYDGIQYIHMGDNLDWGYLKKNTPKLLRKCMSFNFYMLKCSNIYFSNKLLGL